MWQLELCNIYLNRDIKSVSELCGQRVYNNNNNNKYRPSTGIRIDLGNPLPVVRGDCPKSTLTLNSPNYQN